MDYLLHGEIEDFGINPCEVDTRDDVELPVFMQLVQDKVKMQYIPLLRENTGKVKALASCERGTIFFKLKRTPELLQYLKANDQHLSDVLPVIPSNTILDKKITGCGATYGEIKADRHSIIIEPNVPVIKGKCSKPEHGEDNLLGVHEGVYGEQVINYLHQSIKENKRFKILSTPESFQKVKEAFSVLDIDMKEECFLLFDECHKVVKDVDYRENITLPFDDFFQFKSKALVSATPVKFSDPRFNTFKTVEVVPTHNIQKTINLYPTNNILETLKKVILREGKICFFINSTDIIDSVMNTLGIKEESTVFCAPKSVERLNVKEFMDVHEDWQEDRMKKYNFFTSRFYCALDIEMQERPTVVMVTDLYHATHTMLDPRTDIWQIIGRFRNGVADVYQL